MLRRWLRRARLPVDAGPPASSAAVRADDPDPAGETAGPAAPASSVPFADAIVPASELRVRAVLASTSVSPATRQVLTARLDALARPPITAGARLTAAQVTTLRAVIDRLVPQADHDRPVDIVAAIDARLAAGRTDGWRYDVMPADPEAIVKGLAGLDEAAWLRHARDFADLTPERQDALLRLVQQGNVPGETWRTLPPRRWFEDVLAEACEIFVADPLTQDDMGYAGYADLPDWWAIGLDQRDAREPAPVPATSSPAPAEGHTDA